MVVRVLGESSTCSTWCCVTVARLECYIEFYRLLYSLDSLGPSTPTIPAQSLEYPYTAALPQAGDAPA